MATISENLQIIADSTAAIKQAIINKGGDASGDITTWASAISSIQSGGGESEDTSLELVGTFQNYILRGKLTRVPIGGSLLCCYWDEWLVTKNILIYSEGENIYVEIDLGNGDIHSPGFALLGLVYIPNIANIYDINSYYKVRFIEDIGVDPT